MNRAKVLIATPAAPEREAMARALETHGHRVCGADNGKRAIQLFAEQQPDVVVLAASLPVIDGFDVARSIRAGMEPDAPVPVLFLIAPPLEAAPLQGLSAGGEEFLVQPFPMLLLCAKVAALVRARRQSLALSERLARLETEYDELKYEVEAAERLVARMAWDESLAASNMRFFSWPKGIANGDLLLASGTSSRARQVLLGDFTGHGLIAALGTTRVTDVFQTMSRKGCSLAEIARELDAKLHAKLPRDKFLAACLLSLDESCGTLEVCNAGMPEVLVYRPGEGLIARLPSRHLPLGVAGHGDLDAQQLPLAPGDRIYLYSDGVLEACDWDDNRFGRERLERCFVPHLDESPFDVIERELKRFRASRPQRDDITLVEIVFPPATLGIGPDHTQAAPHR